MKIEEIRRKISNKSIAGKSVDYQNGFIDMRDFSLSLLNQLDGEEKPVVPQYVADWFEKNKKDLDYNIWNYCYDWEKQDISGGFYRWFDESDHNPIEILVKMRNGYEIEKPLFAIQNDEENYLVKFSLWGTDGTNHSFEFNPEYKLTFTDKESAKAVALLSKGKVVPVEEK